MLIPPRGLKFWFRVAPVAIVHVGAHAAEEADLYDKYFPSKVLWIEAQSDLAKKLEDKFRDTNHQVVHAAVWDSAGVKLNFKNSSNSQSSSLLELGTHAKNYPSIHVLSEVEVITSTLNEIVPSNFAADFINLDIQGAELKALRGFSKRLGEIKWIYSEVNNEEVYEGCSLVAEMDKFLKDYSFYRVETRWFLGRGWGDALYIKSDRPLKTLQLKFLGGLHSMPWKMRELLKYSIRVTLFNTVFFIKRIINNQSRPK